MNEAGPELRHLRVLVALAQEGTFTDAAIELGLSQPAVSRALGQLETLIGVPLVLRTTRSLTLTPAGEAARHAAQEALAAVAAVTDAARGRMRPLRLGYSWAAFGVHTNTILRRWRSEHPDLALEVHRVDEPSAGLRTGLVDVTVRRGRVGDRGVRTERIAQESRYAAVPRGSRLAARGTLTLADLAGATVAISMSGVTRLDLWPADQRPQRVIEVTNTDEWLMAIASGEAVGVTAESTATLHTHPGVVFVPIPEAPLIPVSLVWPRTHPHPAVDAFRALVRRIIAPS